MGVVGETMNILIWASCEASRPALCNQCCTKIKPGRMPEEILNRFDTNYIVLPAWECTLLASLTVIILNYKHWMPACSSLQMQPLFAHEVHSSLKLLPPLNGLEAPSSLLSRDPNFSLISKMVKFIKMLCLLTIQYLKKKSFYLFIVGCAESSLPWELFSSYSDQGLLSSCGAWAFHCSGFSCCKAWALGLMAAARGLNRCGTWALFTEDHPGPGIEPVSPYHWATREAPQYCWRYCFSLLQAMECVSVITSFRLALVYTISLVNF